MFSNVLFTVSFVVWNDGHQKLAMTGLEHAIFNFGQPMPYPLGHIIIWWNTFWNALGN